MEIPMMKSNSPSFNVGITGHRNIMKEEEAVIYKQVYKILQFVKIKISEVGSLKKDTYNSDELQLRVVSQLAEGSDRIAAKVALDSELGYTLQCIIPMKKEDYIEDFQSEFSRNEFEELISRSESVMEIDFGRDSIPTCYADACDIMLEHIDMLIAVWDGQTARGIGGTAYTVRNADQQRIPILWIHRLELDKICYITMSVRNHGQWQEMLEHYIRDILTPTKAYAENISEIDAVLNGKDLHKSVKFYTLFVKLLSLRKKRESKKSLSEFNKEECRINLKHSELYVKNYETIDKLASYYADIYRSVSLMRALLPFTATVALAFGFYWNWGTTLTLVNVLGFFLQALCLFLIIFLSKKNEKSKWHKKFIDYRILAELFRQLIYFAPMGYASRGIRDITSSASWYKSYYRNTIRNLGIPAVTINKDYMYLHLSCIKKHFISEQINYHSGKIEIFNRISTRLNKAGNLFFAIGIAITGIRGVVYWFIQSMVISKEYFGIKMTPFFNMLSLLLPAIGVALFTILNQCGFENLEQKHRIMKTRLEEIEDKSKFLGDTYNEIAAFILRLMNLALEEVSDWRLFVKSKPIKKT